MSLHLLTLLQTFRRKQRECAAFKKRYDHIQYILDEMVAQTLMMNNYQCFSTDVFAERRKRLSRFLKDLEFLQPISIRNLSFVKHNLGIYIMEQRLGLLIQRYGTLKLQDLTNSLFRSTSEELGAFVKEYDGIIIPFKYVIEVKDKGKDKESDNKTISDIENIEDAQPTQVIIQESQIKLSKLHPHGKSVYHKLRGIKVTMHLKNKLIHIFGNVVNDPLRRIRDSNRKIVCKRKYVLNMLVHREMMEGWEDFLDCILLRDWIVEHATQLYKMTKDLYMKKMRYSNMTTEMLKREYNIVPDTQKYFMILLLSLISQTTTKEVLNNNSDFPQSIFDWVAYLPSNMLSTSSTSAKDLQADKDSTKEELPYPVRISNMAAPAAIKRKAFDMLQTVSKSSDNHKAKRYLDGLLRIPFGLFRKEKGIDGINTYRDKFRAVICSDEELYSRGKKALDVSSIKMKQFCENIKLNNEYPQLWSKVDEVIKMYDDLRLEKIRYIQNVEQTLCEAVHGHDEAKREIKRLVAQWANGKQEGMIIGLQGPPGNGKTTLIKKGLAKCLVDEKGNSRPVGFIPLGGSSRGSSLEGHSYTYQGSKWGRIVDIIMTSKCMNPILLFDELDKVSNTEHGQEITGILTHLTDSTQNTEFYDRYFDGIPIDLSKALMVFTFNDPSRIDRILLDRITVIQTRALTSKDKLVVAKKHLLPEIIKAVGFGADELSWKDSYIIDIIEKYTMEAGVRKLKEILKEIVRESNLKFVETGEIPAITEEYIEKILHARPSANRTLVPEKLLVGQINGLYANSLGIGGVLPIQVNKIIATGASGHLGLKLTGMQGDVMKESMDVAKTIALSMLSPEIKTQLEEAKTPFGIHIHCPSAATPKDGPSAGVAITLAMLSRFNNRAIKPTVAMTGEIDLQGTVCPIGGLRAKLDGAYRANAKLVLIPKKENWHQYEVMLEKNELDCGDKLNVVAIEHITDALQYVFE